MVATPAAAAAAAIATVVKALQKKNDIGNCVVCCKDNLDILVGELFDSATTRRENTYHGRKNTLQNGPNDVEQIAQKPHCEKG